MTNNIEEKFPNVSKLQDYDIVLYLYDEYIIIVRPLTNKFSSIYSADDFLVLKQKGLYGSSIQVVENPEETDYLQLICATNTDKLLQSLADDFEEQGLSVCLEFDGHWYDQLRTSLTMIKRRMFKGKWKKVLVKLIKLLT